MKITTKIKLTNTELKNYPSQRRLVGSKGQMEKKSSSSTAVNSRVVLDESYTTYQETELF